MTKYSCGCESNCDDRKNPKMVVICAKDSIGFFCGRCGFPSRYVNNRND